MVRGIGGFRFLDSRHCEKTSYIAFGGMIATIVFLLVFLAEDRLPVITLPIFGEQPYLYVAFAFFVGGYSGVIFYKVSNNKPLTLRTVIIFWVDK